MRSVSLGSEGALVPAVALGCMAMSGLYGPADDAESIKTIHSALESGITLLDTADFYGMGHNEFLLRRALEGGKRDRALISLKFGALRTPSGGWGGIDARPAALRNFLAYSLIRLGTDYVDIYRPARLAEALAAAALSLDGSTLAEIEQAIPPDPVAGTRYDAAQMAHLDSENPAPVRVLP